MVVHRCTIYGLTGAGSRMVIEIPAEPVAVQPEERKEEPKSKKVRISYKIKDKTVNGTKLTLQ